MKHGLNGHFKNILIDIGEDPEREGLRKTPARAAKAIFELTSGYTMSLDDIVNEAIFENEKDAYDQLVVVRNIEFSSLCEHHILPFMGTCDVGYIPYGKIIGLSKIPRIVDMFSKRLQVQERLTQEIAWTLNNILDPQGVAVVCRAKHTCSSIRGVKKQNSEMVTSEMIGVFRQDAAARMEFLEMLK